MSGGFAQQQPAQPMQQQRPMQQPMQAQQPQSDARPLGTFGMMKQRAFNQGQQKMNGGMPGGKFNKRRF
jgi:hypothetical protein